MRIMYLPAIAFGRVQRSFPRKSGECSRASDAARRIVLDAAPAVILLERIFRAYSGVRCRRRAIGAARASRIRGLRSCRVRTGRRRRWRHPRTRIGRASRRGVGRFRCASGGCLPVALDLVEQRLRGAREIPSTALHAVLKQDANTEAFGEVLCHELNNSLTGASVRIGRPATAFAAARDQPGNRTAANGTRELRDSSATILLPRPLLAAISPALSTATSFDRPLLPLPA
jgi:hypothetical protein